MGKLENDIRKYGGLVSMSQLLYLDHWREIVKIALMHGAIVRVRRGWYALPTESDAVMRAWRVGGRLACASALAHWSGAPQPSNLHVEVPGNAAHLHNPDDPRLRLGDSDGVVVHWARNMAGGDSRAVDRRAAERQLARCGG